MFRDGNIPRMSSPTVNCVFMNGGVGDHVAALTAVDYIKRQYPWVNLLVWVPDFLLDFAKNVLPEGTVVRNYTSMKKHYDRNKPTITTEWTGRHSPMKVHCVDYAFHVLCDEHVDISQKNYLKVKLDKIDVSKFNLPEKYITLATGYTAAVREFTPSAVNGVIDYVKSQGYEVVFLGQKSTPTGAQHVIQGTFDEAIDYEKGIDLINETSLLEAAKIIDGSTAMVGVDCGLMHVAGCTKAPIVGGFTTVNPELRAPIRDGILGKDFYSVVPNEDLGCRFCQVRTNFLYGHDYKNCIYNDRLCVSQLTADKFIEKLKLLLVCD